MHDWLVPRGVATCVVPAASTLLDTKARDLPDVLRSSVHYYNSEDELKEFAALVKEWLVTEALL